MSRNASKLNRIGVHPAEPKTYSALGLNDFSRSLQASSSARYNEETRAADFIKRYIKLPDKNPTDAFGEIEFGINTAKTAKYVRVSDETPVDVLYQLLTRHWKLKTPNLIISVTGGAKNFTLRTRVKEVFRRSLIKASENTGAWITTGGTHAGVMKHVGKAVKAYAAIRDDRDRVVTVGIAPWGVIHGNHKLENHPTRLQVLPKVYDPEESKQGKKVVLDFNHSHFILVDDGSEGKYGTEIELRTALESHIAGQKTRDGINVMIVCVIVQGGPGSLKTVTESIGKGTPVVIVGGSGGWADILAAAYTMDERQINEASVTDLLLENSMEPDEKNLQSWTQMVKTCISNKNLISVFDLDPTDLSRDLDIAILEALLKANANETQSHEQLRLAMAWNRSDIAKSHILNDDACIEKEFLAEMFFSALRDNKHKFCKVFLDHGVDLKVYCTVQTLRMLYEAAPKNSFLCKKLDKRKANILLGVGRAMVEYLGHSYITVYKKRKEDSEKYSAILEKRGDRQEEEWLRTPWSYDAKLDDPYREIFQWAILCNYREIARHIWEYMFESMTAAIIATKILKSLAAKTMHDHEKKTLMLADADEYEALAAGILAKCFAGNADRTIPLLIGRLPKWGGYTCLHVAIEANDKFFVSRPGVQYFLDKVWMDKLADDTGFLHILLAGICVPLIFLTVRYKEKEEDVNKDEKVIENGLDEKSSASDDVEMGTLFNVSEEATVPEVTGFNNPEVNLKANKRSFSVIEKLIIFYDAPVVTFWMNVLAFLIYLGLFAFIILSDFQTNVVTVSAFEYVLVAWITTFLFEEIRELADQEARYLKEKIIRHVTDAWNIMDLISLTLFYIGFGLRWFSAFLDEALVLYTFAFMTHCVRIVHIFAVHHVLGPKIIMVGKMLKDLLFFLFILVVFLVAYGVASQALLYPSETSFTEILVGIIYRPYWQIYGELFLDEINYNPNLDEFTCSDTDSSLPRCPQQSTIVPIISAVYLLFANVLLLNLLIAMFSYTFENVERQSNEIWMFQRYNLITDYYFRPPLVPPLIILSHIFHFVSFVKRKVFSRMRRDDPFHHALKMELDDVENKQLLKWEHWHAEAFMHEKHEEDNSKVDRQLERLNYRIDNITSAMEDMQDRLKGQRGEGRALNKLNTTMLKRFQHLEKMIETAHASQHGGTLPVLPKTPKALLSVEEPPKKVVVSTESAKPKPSPKQQKKEILPADLHIKSRKSPYPGSSLARTSVPDDKVLWKVEWPAYRPVSYNDPILKSMPPWADEDLEAYDDKTRPRLPFNKYDQNHKVNRASHTGTYYVTEGIPRNPRGRTGLCGRGSLGRYGPNHAADPVVTRWKRDENKKIIKIANKPVLEFVAIKRADTGEWAIPGGMIDPGENVSATLKREFSEEALNIADISDPEEIEKIKHNVRTLFNSGGLELFKGYCDDHRNTDNAWIETVARNFHDEEGTAFNNIKLSPGEEANKVSWRQVDHNLKLFASHFDILKKTAEMHNAYF